MIELIRSYWYFPIVVFVFGIMIGHSMVEFFREPTEQQIKQLSEWLRYAVAFAERDLGTGTGQLKLRYVYDLFLDKFPKLAKLLTMEEFSIYVDEALIWMRSQAEKNTGIKSFINGI